MLRTVSILIFIASLIYSYNFNEIPSIKAGECSNIRYRDNDQFCDGNSNQCKWFLSCRKSNMKCAKGFIGSNCEQDSDCFLAGFQDREAVKCVQNECVVRSFSGFGCKANETVNNIQQKKY